MAKKLFYLLLIALVAGCVSSRRTAGTADKDADLRRHIEAVAKDYAPDGRTTWYKIEAVNGVVKGETNSVDARTALRNRLSQAGLQYIDSIMLLPAAQLAGQRGLVTLSVANIRVQPSHRSELATQATMGTPLNVLKRQRGWFLVQTPDHYIGWVDAEAVNLRDSSGMLQWLRQQKLIFTEPYGHAFDLSDSSAVISDLVYGDVMILTGEHGIYRSVVLPDGRTARVPASQTMPYHAWRTSRQPTPDNIIASAKKLMGIPYLWGGTSFKGVDCSGFTKTVFFMNGIVLPRDASQQVVLGTDVDVSSGFGKLQPGDLLFFGSPARNNDPERVVHVGIWIGNNEFIHSSGKVQIASFDPNAPNYDAGEHKRFLRAKRYLPSGGLIDLRTTELY